MHVRVLGSGSRGNALLVRAGELCVLLDAGLPLRELEDRLDRIRVPPHRIDAIALTHGHLDHTRSVGRLARRSGATVLCCERLMGNRALRKAQRFRTLRIGSRMEVEGDLGTDRLTLTPRAVPHDAEPTVAFRFEHEGRVAALLTDLGSAPPGLEEGFRDAHLLVLEFNHDRQLLDRGPYPPHLRSRIRGPRGHLSNDQAAALLARLAGPRLHTVVLAHLSRENNTPRHALAAARRALADRPDVRFVVAEQDTVGPNLEV